MAKRKDRTGSITVRLVRGRDVGASVRQRLHASEDTLVEQYTYHRPTYDHLVREETARLLRESM